MTKSAFKFIAVLAWIVAGDFGNAAEPNDAKFSANVAPVLKTYCVACHGGEKPKADLALDVLAPDFSKNGETWKGIVDRLTDGSMPPKGKPRPTVAEQQAVADWVTTGLTNYQAERTMTAGRARLRRLNRVEYVNTLHNLLGVEVDKEMLPDDGIASGFDNVDAALDLSSTLLEGYLETANAALDAVFVKGPRPETRKLHIDLVPLAKQITKTNRPMPRYGTTTKIGENEVVFYSAAMASKPLLESKAPTAGLYRFRISARAINHGTGMTLLIYTGKYGMGVQGLETRAVAMVDVTDTQTVVEFTTRLDVKESISIMPYGMPKVYVDVADDYPGPGLAVQWVEVEGPIIESWPPASTARLLGDVDLSKGTAADAMAILRRFAPRAFRRPVTDTELEPFMGLVNSRLEKGYSFEAALRVGLTGILCSPHFLYLSETPGKLNDFDLASRLSYFLWSSTPDDTLADLAAKGELSKTEVLRLQVERMLNDPKAHALTENFTGQWLSLRNLMATIPDKKLYPEFDELLEFSMPRETYLFFEEVLKHDRSILEFVHSDWTILNERLATLYGIPDVHGSAFRMIQLPPASHRGGVITHAAVLKVTANGTNTSPVVRGAWVLDHILGTPAPPPPEDVPAIEPDVRGAKTIREQLAKHRQIESCAACHAKIDPPGNALENFDVIGGWREYYRVVPGNGRQQIKLSVSGGRVKGVGKGPNVDAGDALSGGGNFADVDEFKKLVLGHPEQLARGLTEKLLIYATGHGMEFADREAVEKILAEVKPQNYGFRTLIHTIVQSPTFRSK